MAPTREAPLSEIRRTPAGKRLLWGALAGAGAAVLASLLGRLWIFQSFELRTLDWRQQLLARPTAAVDKVAIILIDDYSVRAMRKDDVHWPWPRDVYEPLVFFLKEAGARGVVFDLIFEDRQRGGKEKEGPDAVFARACKEAGNVSFAVKLAPRPPSVPGEEEAPPAESPQVLEKARIPVEGWVWPLREGNEIVIAPIPELVEAAAGLGLVNVAQDRDNTLRRADLVQPYPDSKAPMASLPLEAARHFLGRAVKAEVRGGFWILGDSKIPLGKDGRVLVRFYGKEQTFKTDNAISVIRSFLEMQEGKPPRIPAETFKDRVVFIGVNMAGMEDVVTAPVSTRLPGTEFLATVTANLLAGEWLREPEGAVRFLALLCLGLAGGVLAFLIWRPLPSAGAVLLLLGAWWAIGFGAFGSGLVLDMFFPALVLGGTFVAEIVAAYFAEGRQKKEVSRAFAQYLSPVVIQDLMRKPGALKLGGETREITVSFSDIKGFSSFSEGMTPGELVSFLNVYLTTMTDVILEHRGVVDKYVGDLVMAFWGAPVGLDDSAARACLAVLDQRKAVAKLNEGFKAEGRPAIQFRTGINTGPAVVGNMGSTQRFDYTAMGDTVNLASRLEGANKFFGTYVMMSDATRMAAGETIVARRLGRVQVVGKGIPTTVHELLGRPGDLLDRDLERLRMYHEALEVLESGRAGECARILEGLLAEARDPVVELYLKKAKDIDETRAPWDGVWVLTSKG